MNYFEAVVRGPDDVSNNRLKFADVPEISFRFKTSKTSKNNFREIDISRPRPLDSLVVLISSVAK